MGTTAGVAWLLDQLSFNASALHTQDGGNTTHHGNIEKHANCWGGASSSRALRKLSLIKNGIAWWCDVIDNSLNGRFIGSSCSGELSCGAQEYKTVN